MDYSLTERAAIFYVLYASAISGSTQNKSIVPAIVFETVCGRETAVERTRMYSQCVEKIVARTISTPLNRTTNAGRLLGGALPALGNLHHRIE